MLSCSPSVCRLKTTMQRATGCCVRHSAYIALNGPPTTALSFISPTVIGSPCCDGPDLRSRTWSRFVREQTRRRRTHSSPSSGRGNGQAKKYGRRANVKRLEQRDSRVTAGGDVSVHSWLPDPGRKS